MKIKLFLISFLLLTATVGYAQEYDFSPAAMAEGKTVVFRFVGDDDMFYIPWQDNGEKLDELLATVDHYKKLITDGVAKIDVAGYSSYYDTVAENLKSATVRANRVKSELILHNGIKEDNFHTTVHATSYEGWKSVVVVTLRVPQIQPPVEQKPEPKPEAKPEPKLEPKKEVVEQVVVEEKVTVLEFEVPKEPYCLSVRTNLLYDAFLLPTLGVEWRVNKNLGIKLDGSYSFWGDEHGNVQKIWLVSPEVRWYMGDNKRFYVGASANFGEYNIYRGMVGGLLSGDTGYQGKLWSAGATVGYQLYLSRSFSLDFNVGLGYVKSDYDSFTMVDGVRVYKDRNVSKGTFGPTQAGVNLVWTIGGNK